VHPLLERQLRKRFGTGLPADDRIAAFLEDVDTAYKGNDADRTLLERSIELASAELFEQNEQLASDLEAISRLELELRQVDKLRAVGQLAAGIAHEINTPIQFVGDSVRFIGEVVTDLVDLCRATAALYPVLEKHGLETPELTRVKAALEVAELGELGPDLERALTQSTQGLARVAQIVQAMKRFGHVDSREKVLADVNQCMLDTLTVAASEIREVADVVVELGELPLLPCYPSELNQVFLNLVVNAAHAIGERFGSSGRGEIRITTAVTSGAVVVTVTDNGGGIDPVNSRRIFEPFFTTKGVGRGTGQGLAISRSIVTDQHAGTLSFQSRFGDGTTFVVGLPMGDMGVERSDSR
jgi:two-component system NtrC family sensor kinase